MYIFNPASFTNVLNTVVGIVNIEDEPEGKLGVSESVDPPSLNPETIPPLLAVILSSSALYVCSSSKEKGSSSCPSIGIGSPPIRPPSSSPASSVLAFVRRSSKNFIPKNCKTSAGTTYSPSLNRAGMSSLTSDGKAPGGTSLPLTGSIFGGWSPNAISVCSFNAINLIP